MPDHYELRDHVDDLPYARTYPTLKAAETAARSKSARLGHPVQVWRVTERGETFEGEC